MDTPLYDSMNKLTRQRFTQKRFRYGKEQPYKPHSALVKNLATKLGWPREAIIRQLHREREYLMKRVGF